MSPSGLSLKGSVYNLFPGSLKSTLSKELDATPQKYIRIPREMFVDWLGIITGSEECRMLKKLWLNTEL